MARKTFQVSLRIDDTVGERTARVAERMLEGQPALRVLLGSLPAQLRVVIDRGLEAFEADMGLPPFVEPDDDAPPPRKSAAPRSARKKRTRQT